MSEDKIRDELLEAMKKLNEEAGTPEGKMTREPEVPEAEAAPEAPETAEAPEVPKAEEVPEVPEVPEAEVAQEVPEAVETEAAPEVPEAEAAPEFPVTGEPVEAEIPAETAAAAATVAAEAIPPEKHRKHQKPRNQKKQKKAEAKEDLRELSRQTRADRQQYMMEQHQLRVEEREKYPTGKLRRKAKRLRWKQEKQNRRLELKKRYRDAPWLTRVCRLYLLKPLVALLIIGGLAAVAYSLLPGFIGTALEAIMEGSNKPVSQEEIYKLSPIDKEGAKRIDAVAPVDKNDTWTISVYIVGSNLEDMGVNELSAVVQSQIADTVAQKTAKSQKQTAKRLSDFSAELKDNDLELPAYLYYPNKPVKAEEEAEEDSGDPGPGAASTDIEEMTAETWSDNIRIVIQTGGATRWSNTGVNPNRTQRFLYHKGHFEEVYNQPLEDITDPKSLTSFLNFCKDEYPADHNMLVLWNHGGASFGYGHDSIHGGMMSLADVREGLEGAYEPNQKDPAFDVIGYDACLMSSVEVAHSMSGFASYYAVSEESEPGEGWDYTSWLKAMTKDPTMSPAKVAQSIADSYMDYYMTKNVNTGWLMSSDVTFAVLDAKKAEQLYDAWCDLTKKQLVDATKDRGVLADIGRCSDKSAHMPASVYNLYNTIDLGNYIDLMVDSYPAEASKVKKLLGETVMYHRENGALSETQGISVYMPGSVESYGGLMMCLEYINDICDDPATRALYYYKIAGCLTEDMEEYLATLTDDKMPVLNLKPFGDFAKAELKLTDTGFEIPIDKDLQTMLQSYLVETAVYDKKTGTVLNYGKDELARLDGEGNMDCEFDGTWICLDGVPLATEVIATTESSVEYRSNILYNGKNAYLSFAWDRDKEEFTINGVKGAYTESVGLFNELLGSDPYNYMVNTRMTTELKPGDIVVPIYAVDQSAEEASEDQKPDGQGEEIRIRKRSEIKSGGLPSGYYLNAAVISDTRGDVYYSKVVGNDVSGGKVKKRELATSFTGRDY